MVRPNGEIDWWTPIEFDSPPALWSLLDPTGSAARWHNARLATWNACPAGRTAHTIIRIGSARVQLWDGVVSDRAATLLIRLVKAMDSACELVHEVSLGGFDAPRVQWTPTPDGAVAGGAFTIVGDGRHLVEGERSRTVTSSLSVTSDVWAGFAVVAARQPTDSRCKLSSVEMVGMLAAAEQADRRSLGRIRLPADHPSRAVDALRVLHALTDAATGAPVASPTTSLPEAVGGTRQFDYRYTWLRDSANAVAAAALIGHLDAATDYLGFVHSLVHRYGRRLTPITTTRGERVPDEREVTGVGGWGGSVPVRVGNDAGGQRQIDAVAAVIDAIWVEVTCGGRMSRESWQLIDHLASLIIDAPVGASNGVWEFRDARHLVSEEVARWAGLDRALRLKWLYRPWLRRPQWATARGEARARVEQALDPVTGMLHQTFGDCGGSGDGREDDRGSPTPDAASLLVAFNGFFRRRDPRLARLVRATISALEEGAFLRRYPPRHDEFTGTEGAFVPASWWAVRALAAIGDVTAAQQRADQMCVQLPPLQPEMWSVDDQQGLGNTPLLWSHTECARALYALHNERIRERGGTAGLWLWRAARYLRLRLRRSANG